MAKRKEHHVIPRDNGWAVKKAGASRDTKHFECKIDAIGFARSVSKNQSSEVIIHGRDGKIQRADIHYPMKPKEKKYIPIEDLGVQFDE